MYVALYVIATRKWLPNSQKGSVSKRVAILLTNVVEMVEFDLGQMVFDEIVKHAKKVHLRHLMSFPSLIFQVLPNQSPRIV